MIRQDRRFMAARQQRLSNAASYACERLEDRRLLSGVTLITHGFQLTPGNTDWMDQMAIAVAKRAGNLGPNGNVAWYRAVLGSGIVPGTVKLLSFDKRPFNYNGTIAVTPDSDHASSGNTIITVDWSIDANHTSASGIGINTDEVAAAIHPLLTSPNAGLGIGSPRAELPIHLIGHSRGGSVMVELAKDLGAQGIWVDQLTTLDPHPLARPDLGVFPLGVTVPDPPIVLYDNIVFADNYWRADGLTNQLGDFDGQAVATSHSRELSNSILSDAGYTVSGPIGLTGPHHSDVHLWYHGTIDQALQPSTPVGSDGVKIGSNWYGGVQPGRSQGFQYSLIAGDDPSRAGASFRPSDGMLKAFDSNGVSRSGAPRNNDSQWPNVAFVSLDSTTSVAIGQWIPLTFRYADYNKAADVTLFLDTDRNPYNGFVSGNPNNIMGPSDVSQYARGYDPSLPARQLPTNGTISLDTAGTSVGSYYLCAEIKDNDYRRFAYMPGQITLSQPTPTPLRPIASLAAPVNNTAIDQATINARNYLDITFSDQTGDGLDLSSILDSSPEFSLGGAAGSGVSPVGTPTRLSGTTYRYPLSGNGFGIGTASITFTPGSFRDNDGNLNLRVMQSFTVTTSGADTTPPVISNVGASAGVNSALVTWTTNEPATTQVEYDTNNTASHTLFQTNTTLTTIHSITLPNLASNVTYYFRVWSVDGAGYKTHTDNYSVKTGAVTQGALQVSITPQLAIDAGAQWRVDGGNYQNSGTVLSGLAAGNHVVGYKPLNGWISPVDQTINVVAGQTTSVGGAYAQQPAATYTLSIVSGDGSVVRSPQASSYPVGTVVSLTAQPSIGQHFAWWSGAASGTQNPISLVMDSDKSVTANWAVGDLTHGALQVGMTPASAVAAGAAWSIDGGKSYYIGGSTLQGLSAGQYTIQYWSISGFTKPANQTVNVAIAQTTQVTGTYIPDPQFGGLQVGITPPAAVNAGAQWRLDGGAWQNNGANLSSIAVGSHQVQYKPVAGWTTPVDVSVQIGVNQTSVLSGAYGAPIGQPIISSLSPNTGPLTGGIQVVIHGANFEAPATVLFGNVAATNVSVDSATQITATLPATASYGTVAVKVTMPSGTVTNPSGFSYMTPRGDGMQLIGHVGGSSRAIAVQGNYAYIGEGNSLAVINISNPSSPTEIGHVPLPGLVSGISVSGQYAYVADSDSGLQVVDISSPTAPALRGFYETSGYAGNVEVLGGLAYVAAGQAGLQIIDVSNPTAPRFVGAYQTSDGSSPSDVGIKVYPSGVFAYIVDGGFKLRVVDVSTPSIPQLRATFTASTLANFLTLDGSRAYISGQYSAYSNPQIIDITDPNNPTLLSTYANNQNVSEIAVANGYAYSVWGGGVLDVFDVSNPTNPTHVTYLSAGLGQHLAISGGRLFVVADGIKVVNISNPQQPALLGQYSPPAVSPEHVIGVGLAAYVSMNNLFQSFDMTDPSNPVLRGALATGAQRMTLSGSRIYVAGNPLTIIDVSNFAQPTVIGTYSASHVYPVDIAVAGSVLYVAGGDPSSGGKLDVVDVSNPASPVEKGYVRDSGYYLGVAVRGSYAYAVQASGALQVINVSDSSSPQVVTSLTLAHAPYSITLSPDGQYAFVGEIGAVEVFRISTPSAPVSVGTYPLIGTNALAWDMTIAGDRLFVAGGSTGVLALDYTDPANLVLTASYRLAGYARGISVVGDSVYVAGEGGGLDILRLLDRTSPTATITNPTFNPTYSTSNGTINLGGATSDNKAVTRVIWSNDRGGSGNATGTDIWQATGVALQPGQNVLTVTAIDAAGNRGTDILTVTYTPVQLSQTITFPGISNKTFGDAAFALNATANSGLPVAYNVISGPASVTDNMVSLSGAGTVVVRATQAGNAFFGSAPSVDVTFTVGKAAQTISVGGLTGHSFGESAFAVNVVATSGLPVTLSVGSGPATIAGNLLTITGAGAIQFHAVQSGDGNYFAAPSVDVSFNVGKASQIISFAALSNQTFGDAPFPLMATSSSGLPVSFSIASGPATIAGNIVTITGAGNVSIRASQAGDANYLAAADVLQSINPGQTPFKGAPIVIGASTGTIQVEDFDLGGEGVAYHDAVSGNIGGQYRPTESVDIKLLTSSPANYRLADAWAGEWLEYSINVTASGLYNFEIMVSNTGAGGVFHLELDPPTSGSGSGTDLTGALSVPNTGSFSTMASVIKGGVSLTAGAHVLRLVLDQNSTASKAAGAFDAMKISPSATPTVGSISGFVFNDLNGNGLKDTGENGLAGITLYNDADNDKVMDANEARTTTIDVTGEYQFSNLAAGSYKIRQILPSGWSQTTPASGYGWTVALAASQTVTDRNFGARQAVPAGGSISGSVFNDLNGNGKKDTGESGLSGRTIWIDLDNDAKLDANEKSVLTDAAGNYTLSGLAAGTYKVRQLLPTGWKQTTPSNGYGITVPLTANQKVTGKLFGEKKI